MVGQRDRTPQLLEMTKLPWPAPPLNIFMLDGTRGAIDLRWDDPSILSLNSGFQLLGVNVYRSFDSEFGPYHRISDLPIGATFWRDQTDNELVVEEDVSSSFILFGASRSASGSDAPRYVFKTLHYPIVKSRSDRGQPTNTPGDVRVFVDGVEARVLRVSGATGEVELDANIYTEVGRQKTITPILPTTASRVTCTYLYPRSVLKTDLSQRIFYRVTTVGIPVSCNPALATAQDLVETPLEHAAATNTFEIEKLDYIWREAIRRNRWILQQGGERASVFLRKNVGVPCTCVSPHHKQPISDCHVCFVPGTMVNTELGWRPIELIQKGERVLASDGTYRVVKTQFKTQYSGSLRSITPATSTNPIRVTASHPFRVLRGDHQVSGMCSKQRICDDYIMRGDGIRSSSPNVKLLPSGNWWARAQANGSRGVGRVSLGTFSNRDGAVNAVISYRQDTYSQGHRLAWDEAQNLTDNDWLVTQWDSSLREVKSVCIPPEFLKVSKYGPKRIGATEFELDEEFLWVLGLYLAEGSTGGRTVSFALHAKETEFQDRVVRFFERYGYHPKVRVDQEGHGNGAVVTIPSTSLANWLSKWLGHLCYRKHIPQELMCLPQEKTWALIHGVYAGDGTKRANEITQTSEVLALQLVDLLHRLGEQPLVRRQQSTKLTPKGNKRRLAYCVSWADNPSERNRKNRWAFNHPQEGQHMLSRIKETVETSYCGPVFNLEVEGDPTYVVNGGIVVHNCFGVGVVGGYEGPYPILIAPDDAEVAIRQKETGRVQEHTYEVWTGPTPLLSHRDFIMKVNGDRYSIGPVRMPSNRGNILQQHFSISSFDDKDHRYKVPVGNPVKYSAVQFVPSGPEHAASQEVTNNPNVGDERELKGRTLAWKNQNT